jgi:hypothetical protein
MRSLNVERKGKIVNPAKPEAALEFAPVDQLDIRVQLLTPLFGGGVEARKVDENHWLRPSEVKAGIRFWWRVLHGRSFPSSVNMWEKESDLFGRPAKTDPKTNQQIGGRGVFSLGVESAPVHPMLNARDYAKPNTPQSVAYFAAAMDGGVKLLAESQGRKEWPTGTIRIHWLPGTTDLDRDQVLHALSAFLVFGGVGSRTRKGAGALAPLTPEDAQALKHYPVGGLVELGSLKPQFPPQGKEPAPPVFFGGHGSVVLMASAGMTHGGMLEVWKEVRKAARGLNLTASQSEPRRTMGLPLATKKGGKTTYAQDRLASPVWGGVARIWPGYKPEAESCDVPANTMAVFLVGDPPADGPVPVKGNGDLNTLRQCITNILEQRSFKRIWSI